MKIGQALKAPGAVQTSHIPSEQADARGATTAAGNVTGTPHVHLPDLSRVPPEVVRVLLELAESGLNLAGLSKGIDQQGPLPPERSTRVPYTIEHLHPIYLAASKDADQVRVVSAITSKAVAGEIGAADLNLALSALDVNAGIVERSVVSLGLDPAAIQMCGIMYHLADGRFVVSTGQRPMAADFLRLSRRFTHENLLFIATSVVIVSLIIAILTRLS